MPGTKKSDVFLCVNYIRLMEVNVRRQFEIVPVAGRFNNIMVELIACSLPTNATHRFSTEF
jgi:hypothetical protein